MPLARHCEQHEPGAVALDYGMKVALMCPCGYVGPELDLTGRRCDIDAQVTAARLWQEALAKLATREPVESPVDKL